MTTAFDTAIRRYVSFQPRLFTGGPLGRAARSRGYRSRAHVVEFPCCRKQRTILQVDGRHVQRTLLFSSEPLLPAYLPGAPRLALRWGHVANWRVRGRAALQEIWSARRARRCKLRTLSGRIWSSGFPRGEMRKEGRTIAAIRQMMCGTPHVKLVKNGWQSWPQFRATVRHMHLLLQPSYTKTFNVVTADGVAEGVPSVVSAQSSGLPTTGRR